jgi:hypothetical protein
MRSRISFEGMPSTFTSALQGHAGTRQGTHANHEFRVKTSEAGLEFDFSSSPVSRPAADYARWHEEWSAALKGWTRPLVWKP